MKDFDKKEITKKSKNISDWYNDIILKAELADYAPVKGTMVIRPYGYAIWERVQEIFNIMIKTKGVENAYFPLFIPHSLLEKEKEHVKGFSPELAIVTIGGGEKLKDPLVVRPTSETIMYEMYAKWIHSWRDLPVLINQWNNVVRWEKRTYLFLRTTEFLWQEGHTAHENETEAIDMAKTALEWYRQIYEEYYAIPVYIGTKSTNEKFAGAKTTYTIEALMPDGKALQGATSHNLGQNFSRPFDIHFSTRDQKTEYVWQTSWGLSTRSLGGLFLTHGDDDGLVLPPKIAPIKAVIIPVLGKEEEKVLHLCEKVQEIIQKSLLGTEFDGKVQIWDDPEKTTGWKANQAEIKGIPIAIRIGSMEALAEKPVISLSTRIGNNTENFASRNRQAEVKDIGKAVIDLLNELQKELFKKAKEFVDKRTYTVDSYEKFKEMMSSPETRGFIFALWCEDMECEKKIQEETKATTRCLPLHAKEEHGLCIKCAKPAKYKWLFAQSY